MEPVASCALMIPFLYQTPERKLGTLAKEFPWSSMGSSDFCVSDILKRMDGFYAGMVCLLLIVALFLTDFSCTEILQHF